MSEWHVHRVEPADLNRTDSMSDLSDEELLALFRKERKRHYAFNLLVRQYQRRLYAFVRRMVTDHDEAQDVLQNSFMKAWHGLDQFRGGSALFSWLYRIAHNESLNHLRRRKRNVFVSSESVMNASPPPWTAASTSAATTSSGNCNVP
jgi:DNA-directed RNA polymerase specialized sigma24 family protein